MANFKKNQTDFSKLQENQANSSKTSRKIKQTLANFTKKSADFSKLQEKIKQTSSKLQKKKIKQTSSKIQAIFA